jgi:hypothetical protein
VGKVKNKLKDSKGAALILVIFAMLMITAGVGIVSLQVNNQIISNKNRSNKSEQTYLAEAGVEKTIADIYEAIESKLKDLNKVTEPKTYADKYVVYCLRESQKYFIRANENMPSGHKDIINDKILSVFNNTKLIENAIISYTGTSDNIDKVLSGVNNLKSEIWYNGVTNNYKKGIGSNVDMGVYYANLAKETLGHLNSTNHTPHVDGDKDKIIFLTPTELAKVINGMSKLNSDILAFEDDPSQFTGGSLTYRDGVTLNKLGVQDYIKNNLDFSNINSQNVKLSDILAKLNTLKNAIPKLKPKSGTNNLSTVPITEIEEILKAATNYLQSKGLLDKSTTELSQYSNIIANFQEGSGKNKLVTKSEVITDITNIKTKLSSININSGNNDAILKSLNEALDELVQLQVDVSNLKPKGNLASPSVAEIDNIKKYIIEIKCNLGRTDYYEKPTDTVTEVQLGKSKEILVSIPAYTHYIDGKSVYKRDAIEFKIIVIIDEYRVNGYITEIIREIRPTTVDILAEDSNDKNKIKANVTFYTETLNNGSKFIVYDHKVNSWDR